MTPKSYVKCAGNECMGGCGNADHEHKREMLNGLAQHVVTLTTPVTDAPSVYRTPHVPEIVKPRMSRELILHRVARGIVVVAGSCIALGLVTGMTWAAHHDGGWTGVGIMYAAIIGFLTVFGSFLYVMENGWKGPES